MRPSAGAPSLTRSLRCRRTAWVLPPRPPPYSAQRMRGTTFHSVLSTMRNARASTPPPLAPSGAPPSATSPSSSVLREIRLIWGHGELGTRYFARVRGTLGRVVEKSPLPHGAPGGDSRGHVSAPQSPHRRWGDLRLLDAG